jgi:hypothetical protein
MATYLYNVGTVRWRRYTGEGDVRAYRAPKGWDAFADLRDTHPITGAQMPRSQWWIREKYTGR